MSTHCKADCFRDSEGSIRPLKHPQRLVWQYFEVLFLSNAGHMVSIGDLEPRQFTECLCGCSNLIADPPVGTDQHESLQTSVQDDEETPTAGNPPSAEITPEEKGPANRRVSLLASCFIPVAIAIGFPRIKRILDPNEERKMSLRAHWILRILAVILIAILWYTKK